MTGRARIQRLGVALAVAGIFLSTVDIDPAGEAPRAFAAQDEAVSMTVQASPSPAPSDGPVAEPDASASPQAKGPEGGDLTHLTFTATDGLSATLIEPADDAVADATTTTLAVQTVRGAGVEVKVDGAVVPFSRIGKRVVDNKTGVTTYTYYGVTLQPGPNDIALTPLGAGDARGTTSLHRIFGPGRIASLALTAGGPLRADGVSRDDITVTARDAFGHHAAAGSVVRLIVVSGDARVERVVDATDAASAPDAVGSPQPLPSSSPDSGGSTTIRQTLELRLGPDGTANARLIPGLSPGDVVLRCESGDASRELRVFLAPNLRKPLVNGLVTAGTGAIPGPPNQPGGEPDGTNARRARVALFATGAMGKSLATVAYDTSNTLRRTPAYGGAYEADPGDKPYTITGDASIRRDDALSRDHLFARLDSGRATAQWGEFRARTTGSDSSLGGYDQLVDGVKLDLNGDRRRLSAFAARNDVGYDRRTFAPSGLANGVALKPNIVVGSEIVVLATIDARTGAVIAQAPLTRGVDYNLEYATGQLRFIEVPLPFDEAFNPHQVVITYEFDAPGNAARTLGGRGEMTFGATRAVKLGFGYVNDTSGAGNVALATEDLSGTMHGGAWSIVHASTRGRLLSTSSSALPAGAGGDALRASYTRSVGNDRLALVYERTDAGYADPFGGLSTPGLLNERFSFAHKYDANRGELSFDAGYQANSGVAGGGNAQMTATLRARRALTKRVTLTTALERRVATSSGNGPAETIAVPLQGSSPAPLAAASYQPLPAQTSTQASLGLDWRASSNVDVNVNRLQTLGGSNAIQPTQTDAQLSYDLGKSGHAYVRERWSAAPVQSFAAATQGLTSATGGTHATEFGFTRNLGPATTVDTAYVIDHGANGGDVFATMGVRERYKIGRFGGDAFYQHGLSAGGNVNGAGFNLYGASFSYDDAGKRFRASGSTQMRTGAGAGVSITLGAIGAISPDLSLFASLNDARAAGSSASDERVGLAWRPSRNDNGVTLLQYERRDGTSALNATQSGVLSLEQVLRVRARTELVGRYAYKLDGDAYYAAHSSLAGLRVGQTVGSRLDVGAEARQSSIRGIAGANATAFAAEAGVRLGDQTRLGVGFNFSGTADPSLATTPTRRGFYATVTSVVDRIFGWGRH